MPALSLRRWIQSMQQILSIPYVYREESKMSPKLKLFARASKEFEYCFSFL